VNILVIVLRLLHVVGAFLWVGTALVNAFFISPTVAALGETGQKFLAHLMGQARLSARITLASYVTVVAGAALYWIDSQGLRSAWLTSGPGIGFGLGAIAGFIGFGFGQAVGKHGNTIARVVGQIKGTPTPEQAAELQRARVGMASATGLSTGFLIAALALMATARYWLL
jgi:hypothetical protein